MLGLEDEFVFTSLGRYSLQKNTTGLVSAFGSAGDRLRDAHLVICGHVEDEHQFAQAMLRREGLDSADRIHLRGHSTSPSVLLGAADAFVLDSIFEGWPMATMEALHAGIPVGTSETGGALEQVGSNGERGFVIPNPLGHTEVVDWATIREAAYGPQFNVIELQSAMIEIANRRDEWRARREEIRREADDLFSTDACARAHSKVLRRAAASTSRID